MKRVDDERWGLDITGSFLRYTLVCMFSLGYERDGFLDISLRDGEHWSCFDWLRAGRGYKKQQAKVYEEAVSLI